MRISGLNELREHLERLRPEEVMAKALAEQAQHKAAQVRGGLSEPPGGSGHDEPWLRSGALRDSVGVQADGLQAAVGSSGPAAVPQELGMARMPARPFLMPVAAGMGKEVAWAVGAAVAAALRGDNPDANDTNAGLSGGGLGGNDPPNRSDEGAGASVFASNANATGMGGLPDRSNNGEQFMSFSNGLEIGPTTGAAGFTPYIDFHTQGDASGDYDARVFAYRNDSENSGNGVKGANIIVEAKTLRTTGTITAVKNTVGQLNDGAVACFVANAPGALAAVAGYTPGLSALYYPDIDSVCTYNGNVGRQPLFTVTSPTFSVVTGGAARLLMPTGVPLTAAQMAQMFRGMQLLTNHTAPWTGWVDTWDPAGTWVQVIGGFGLLGDSSSAPDRTPSGPIAGGGNLQVAFSPVTKIWGENTNVIISGGQFAASKATGYELGVFNNTSSAHTWKGDSDPQQAYTWGYDAVNLGTKRVSAGFIARGDFDAAFQARGGATAAFLHDGVYNSNAGGTGFLSTASTGLAFAVKPGDPTAASTFSVTTAGAITAASLGSPLVIVGAPAGGIGVELSYSATPSRAIVDFHSSGDTAGDYDARIVASGGTTGTTGQGILDYLGSQHRFAGQVSVDDLKIGTSGFQNIAWNSQSITPTAANGPLAATSGTVRYRKFGRTVFFTATANITKNGSGAGTVNLVLPYIAAGDNAFGGRNYTGGKTISGVLTASSATLYITLYDGTYPGADGAKLVISGSYEATS